MRFCDGCGAPQLVEQASSLAQAQFTKIPEFITRVSSVIRNKLRVGSDILLALVLFAVTALTILPFFSGDFTQNWGSIESAYISDSIFIVNNFPNLGWHPFWYGGFPFHLSYPPLFVSLVAVFHALSTLPIGHSYRILGGLGYSAAPVALYLLAKYLTKNRLASFLTGLTYSLVPTFLPSIAPSHVAFLAVYGEAPHLFGFTLALLSILQLFRCISRPRWHRCVVASILVAGVALSNLIALYGLALLLIAAVLTEVMYRSPNALSLTILVGVFAYGFSAFQYDLSFILSSAQFAGFSGSTFRITAIVALATIVMGTIFVHRIGSRFFARQKQTKPFFFCIIWLAIFFVVIAGSQNWLGLPAVAPQSNRYMPEFDAGVSLSVGLLVMSANELILRFLTTIDSLIKLGSRAAVLGVFFMILLVVSVLSLPHSLAITQPTTDLNNVPEYRVATWLSEHVTDESVFATGTVGFWLNVFSNVRQIRGGSDQGATNAWWADVSYQILTGSDPQISILLAQAWNVKYIVVTFPNASTPYHDYHYPMKFVNVLPLRYYFDGNGVYEVPLQRPALIEAVTAEGALSPTPIHDALERAGLSRYVNLTQNSSNDSGTQVTYTNTNPDTYQISVSHASQDTAILVKMTYEPEWRAVSNGRELQISPIGLDFMIIYPQTQGNYSLDLHFNRSLGEIIGLIVTIITLSSVIAISMLDTRISRGNIKVKHRRTATSNAETLPKT